MPSRGMTAVGPPAVLQPIACGLAIANTLTIACSAESWLHCRATGFRPTASSAPGSIGCRISLDLVVQGLMERVVQSRCRPRFVRDQPARFEPEPEPESLSPLPLGTLSEVERHDRGSLRNQGPFVVSGVRGRSARWSHLLNGARVLGTTQARQSSRSECPLANVPFEVAAVRREHPA
jgi:hypothetical protein